MAHVGPTPVRSSAPEIELLICIAGRELDEAQRLRMAELLNGPLDWQQLLKLAQQHRLIALLLKHLNDHSARAVPRAVLTQLEQAVLRLKQRNLYLVSTLFGLLDLLAEQDIRAVPYKGPALASVLYGHIGLRSFGDLDIFVRRKDVLLAKELLIKEGFQAEFRLTPFQEGRYLADQCEYNFTKAEGRLHVEIHWNVLPTFYAFDLKPELWWSRVEMVPLLGKPVWNFALDDLLFLLCLHGFKHCWDHLELIGGIAELTREMPSTKWLRLIEQAQEVRAMRAVGVGLWLARDLFTCELPDAVCAVLTTDRAIERIATKMKARILVPEYRSLTRLEQGIFHWRQRERRPDRLKCAYRLAIVPDMNDWLWWPLPDALSYGYYLTRPLRLLGKYVFFQRASGKG